jgi:translation initiation factor 2B subunit (eIF-2B alpha/beta/delta family)
MKKMLSGDLNKTLINKTLGSSEITTLLNKYFLSIQNNTPEITKSAKLAKVRLGHFEGVNSYLNELNNCLKEKNKDELVNFLKGYSKRENEKNEIIFRKIYPHLAKSRSIITLSRSGTVLNILKLWHKKNKNLRVVICESRPKYEGRLAAGELIRDGIKVELISDAMMGIYVRKIDIAIIGADSVLKNGNIINKVGSKALALLCGEYKKPLYVVTTRSKFSNKNNFKPKKENPQEIWDKKVKNLSVSNVYFEEVEKKLITKKFTD